MPTCCQVCFSKYLIKGEKQYTVIKDGIYAEYKKYEKELKEKSEKAVK